MTLAIHFQGANMTGSRQSESWEDRTALPNGASSSVWRTASGSESAHLPVPANKSFDTDAQLHCAASRARKHTSRGAMQLRAGQLQR